MASIKLEKSSRLQYRLVIDNGFFILYKDGQFPVMVSDNPIAIADWLIDHS